MVPALAVTNEFTIDCSACESSWNTAAELTGVAAAAARVKVVEPPPEAIVVVSVSASADDGEESGMVGMPVIGV